MLLFADTPASYERLLLSGDALAAITTSRKRRVLLALNWIIIVWRTARRQFNVHGRGANLGTAAAHGCARTRTLTPAHGESHIFKRPYSLWSMVWTASYQVAEWRSTSCRSIQASCRRIIQVAGSPARMEADQVAGGRHPADCRTYMAVLQLAGRQCDNLQDDGGATPSCNLLKAILLQLAWHGVQQPKVGLSCC